MAIGTGPAALARMAAVDTLVAAGDLDGALAHVDERLAHRPGDAAFQLRRGVLLRRLHQHGESLAQLSALFERFPDDVEVRLELAAARRMAGDGDGSMRLYAEVLAEAPANRAALIGRIDTALHFQLTDAALRHALAGLAVLPGHVGLAVKLGVVLRKLQRHDESRAHLAALAARHPDNLAVRHELAAACRMTGDRAASMGLYDRTLATDPGNRDALVGRVDTAAHFGRVDEALAHAEAGLARRPAELKLLVKKGVMLRELGRLDACVAHFADLVARRPGNLWFRHELAAAKRQMGDREASLRLYDETLRTLPGHRVARLGRLDTAVRLAGSDEIERELCAALGALGAATSDAGRIGAASLVCRALAGLSSDRAGVVLRAQRDLLAAARDLLPGNLLWSVYEIADLLGLGADYAPFAASLLARETIGPGEARRILMKIFEVGLPGWPDIGAFVETRIPPGDRQLFALERRALEGGAAAALAARPRVPGRRRPASEVLLLSRLLVRVGRPRRAARYLGLAARQAPHDATLFRAHVRALLACGAGELAAARLAARLAEGADLSPDWLAALSDGLAEHGDLEGARSLIERHRNGQLPPRLQHTYINVLFGLGDTVAAAAEIARFRDAGMNKHAAHFAPSLLGLLAADALMQDADPAAEPEFALVSPAMRTVRDWRQRPPAGARPAAGPVPRKIVQYWNDPVPPAEIAAIMRSWEAAAGFAYHCFDRARALGFLRERLGIDWAKALKHAVSPAEESDYFRLCYLMLEGGLYADCDDWLTGDAEALAGGSPGLTVMLEPRGTIGNNLIVAAPRHPVLVWAAAAARRALLERHNDSTWTKTGPGLLTRAVAHYLTRSDAAGTPPDVAIPHRWQLAAHVSFHVPLPYKRSRGYWNRQSMAGDLAHFGAAFRAVAGG
ncbi:tetratricopeptide repeat protein [Methylobrevis albus]|uniref:Tetratricopeptide repeat protein n=1 Tax=Methylobrevis albus TaxID=2793297 RepID=A0A931HYI9_9HYPH|nr:tetratricopeptide repeat protein [Methylobrevis albus]MBH0236202.1 hypothetical protein [Methylobrevis albus]